MEKQILKMENKTNKLDQSNQIPPLGVGGIDENGYYGQFGGAYIPEILHGSFERLKEAFYTAKEDATFKAEYYELLKNYVGRPSPLYFAKRLSAKYGANIYLKREDLNHTGAHKINNALGQILLAKRMVIMEPLR